MKMPQLSFGSARMGRNNDGWGGSDHAPFEMGLGCAVSDQCDLSHAAFASVRSPEGLAALQLVMHELVDADAATHHLRETDA